MARATYDTDGMTGAFSKTNMNNQFHSLFQGDSNPLRAQAQSSPDMTVQVAAADVESFYKQVWINTTAPDDYAGGNSSAISAPAVNPRIDLLYMNTSGVLAWITGTEAASPTAPNFTVAGIPICYVYCKTTMTKIVNYEDRAANPIEGYIYADVRPRLLKLINFLSLPDTPSTYSGQAGKGVKVNSGETALEFSSEVGAIVQVQYAQDNTYKTLAQTVKFPASRDAIPQKTQGVAYSELDVAITPTSGSNILRFDGVVYAAESAASGAFKTAVGLFKDSDAAAIAVGNWATYPQPYGPNAHKFTFFATAPGTSAYTYKIRAGTFDNSSVTMYINGNADGRYFGGVLYSSLVITEIAA